MMKFEEKAEKILQEARKIAQEVKSWADYSNAISDPFFGLASQYFPDKEERKLFCDSPEYEEIRNIQIELMKKFGMVEGATPIEYTAEKMWRAH